MHAYRYKLEKESEATLVAERETKEEAGVDHAHTCTYAFQELTAERPSKVKCFAVRVSSFFFFTSMSSSL